MIDLTQKGISHKDVMKALSNNREIKFRYDLLNKDDIKIGELIAKDSGNTIDYNSNAQIKRIGRFLFKENELSEIDWLNDRVRPVFLIKVKENWLEYPQGVFLITSPTRRIENNSIWRSVEAYDGSLILHEDLFVDRFFIAAGSKYTDVINNILNSAGIWKTNISQSDLIISNSKEFEIGTSKLDVINKLLSEINYESLHVDSNGIFRSSVYQIPSKKNVEHIYKVDKNSVIHDGMEDRIDLFKVPNKWVTYVSNPENESLVSIFENNIETSMTSIPSRGRTIVDIKSINDIADQDTLDNYNIRRANESTMVINKLVFESAIMPFHSHKNILFVKNDELSIANKYVEKRFKIELKNGGKMTHECERVVVI